MAYLIGFFLLFPLMMLIGAIRKAKYDRIHSGVNWRV